MIGIYKITSPDGRIYIGKSKDIYHRFKQHKFKSSNKFLRNSFLIYGYENHVFEVIEECTINELIEKERFYIKLFNKQYVLFNEVTLNHVQYKRNVPVEYVEELDRYLEELKSERENNIHPDFVDKMDKHLNKLKSEHIELSKTKNSKK